MLQAKFTIKEDQIAILNSYKEYGFKDKSSMMREALTLLKKERELRQLRESAVLYAEIYQEDTDLQSLTEAAVKGWPG